MEESGHLAESLTHIKQQHELISKRYDDFIQHIIDVFAEQTIPILNGVEYRKHDDGSMRLLFCGTELVIGYTFDYRNMKQGRINCIKKVNEELALFDTFEYDTLGVTSIPTEENQKPYQINSRKDAINILLYWLKMSFFTNRMDHA
jgi:hypothetical protein